MAKSIKNVEIATSLVALETAMCHGEIAKINPDQTAIFFLCFVSIFTKKYMAKTVRAPKNAEVNLIAKIELPKNKIAGMER